MTEFERVGLLIEFMNSVDPSRGRQAYEIHNDVMVEIYKSLNVENHTELAAEIKREADKKKIDSLLADLTKVNAQIKEAEKTFESAVDLTEQAGNIRRTLWNLGFDASSL